MENLSKEKLAQKLKNKSTEIMHQLGLLETYCDQFAELTDNGNFFKYREAIANFYDFLDNNFVNKVQLEIVDESVKFISDGKV